MKKILPFILIIAFAYYYFTHNGQKVNILSFMQKRDLPVHISVQENPLTKNILQTAGSIGNGAAAIGGKVLGAMVSRTASSAGTVIVKTTVSSLLTQINKLPKDQQEQIRQEICKPLK